MLGTVVIFVKTCGDEDEDSVRDAVKAGLKQKLKMCVPHLFVCKGLNYNNTPVVVNTVSI